MPFKRKFRKRGKVTKDKKQDRQIRRLMQLVTPEWKRLQTGSATPATPVQNTNDMVATSISSVAAGTSANQRIGNSIAVHRIHFTGS